jgi:hypothetical protein
MSVVAGYLAARRRVLEAGFGGDIIWAEDLALVQPDADYVLREAAWVIVNSGFRFQVAQQIWPELRAAFREFKVGAIDASCAPAALVVLNHPGKIDAIIKLADMIHRQGHAPIVALAKHPLELARLPWIGKVTCWHLAKVLGVDVVKPDVHLQRAAHAAGATSPLALCEAIRDALGDRLAVIDTVLWRYGEQQRTRGWPGWAELWAGAG